MKLRLLVLYINELLKQGKSKPITSLALTLFLGLTEGIGLMLIVPILAFAGVGQEIKSSSLTYYLELVFSWFKITPSLELVLIAYVGIIALYALIKYVKIIIDSELTNNFTMHLRSTMFSSLSYSNWLYFTNTTISELTNPLFTQVNRVGSGTNALLQIIGTVVITTVYLIIAMAFSWKITVAVCIGMGILALGHRTLNWKSLNAGVKDLGLGKQMQKLILEHLMGIKTAKSYGAEPVQNREFDKLGKLAFDNATYLARARAKGNLIMMVGGAMLISIFYIVGFRLMEIDLGLLLLLTILFIRLIPKVSAILSNYQLLLNMMPAYNACIKVRDEAIENREFDPSLHSDKGEIQVFKTIHFNNVSFSYPGGRTVFTEMNLVINQGDVLGIAGVSGVGKTTMVDLLLALLQPSEGQITVDDTALRGLDISKWRKQIGYVAQDAFLLNQSIRNNMLWANPSATEEEMLESLEAAAAAQYVMDLPEKLDTSIGDRGVQLSGGQRQRLSIAMALVRRPNLLILDEATNAIDEANERAIFRNLNEKGNLTILLISHRASSLKYAKHIVTIEDGQAIT